MYRFVDAKTEVELASGGASLTMENGNAVFHLSGEFRIKASSFVFEGPAHEELLCDALQSAA